MLTPSEREQLLVGWNRTERDYQRDACVHELFEEHAKRTPQAIGVESDDARLTYAELNSRANRLAHQLRSLGVGPDVMVGLCLERSPAVLVAMLGILKAGGAYVPLDPEYPAERLAFMLEDTAAPVVVTQSRLLAKLPQMAARIVCLDRDGPVIEGHGTDEVVSGAGAGNLAYVIYTSGSTGVPKGVQVTHRAINRLVCNTDYVDIQPADRFAQVSVMSFDAATFEIWGALLNGARVICVPREVSLSPRDFADFLRLRDITVMFLTTALFNQMAREAPGAFRTLRYVLFGGEAVDPRPVRAVLRDGPPQHLLHVYGPTEVTTFSTWYPISEVDEAATTIPIGRPIANTTAYVLDEQGEPVPVGIPGELYLGGDGLARGYLRRPELTAERFVNHSFSADPGARLYRTGDWVRYRKDAAIEFIGRRDHQVKVRGFRIELGEIEAALGRLPQVREVVVVAREDEPGDRQVVAYLVPAEGKGDTLSNLRGLLRQELPDYMVPSAFVVLDRLPLTPNGKVDRAALPAPKRQRQAGDDVLVTPRNELEQRIAKVWREMLQLDQVGIRDNFFDLGGHSLLLVRTHARLCAELDCELKVVDLLTYPTIDALAKYLGTKTGTGISAERVSARASGRSNGSREGELIAVVGMAGRFPGARDVDELWDNLCAGREGVRFFEPGELDPLIPAALRFNPAYVRARGVIEDCDKFDAGFFDVMPLEAQVMDPQQRVMLELAWTALENAGHTPSQFPGLIGVYAGMNWNRYRVNCVSTNPEVVARFGEFNTALANEYDFLATRISYKLNLRGPSVNVSTACSTSLVAIAQASQALLSHECDLALAGGVSISVPVNAGYLYQEGSMLSADGHCRTFDANSTGTTFSDGAGLVVLRRLEDAIQDGDRIYAVVRGFAVNNDGSDKVSFTAPSVSGQAGVIGAALDRANVDPATIGFIEAHGTATPLGDPIEVAALKRVFGGPRPDGTRCALGSVKSAVGHLVHAAGVTGFIKAVLSVHHGKIPPSLFFESPNPRLELDDSPFYVNTSLDDWAAPGHPRRAGVSSFGVGGTNAHVVVEQSPRMDESPASGLPQVLCLSAKSEDALARQIDSLKRFLAGRGSSFSLDAAAYTLQSGREPMQHRAAWVVHSVADAMSALDDNRRAVRGRVVSGKNIAFMFTGQGSQRARMGQWLYEKNAFFRECFDEGAERLKTRTGLDVRLQLFSDSEHAEREVDQTRIAQPALFLLEYSLARTLESMGVTASVLLGHSIGEFVAATLAGVFTYDDALYVVAKRGEAMQSMPRGSMLVLYCGEDQARSCLSADISLAAINAPDLSVLSGPDGAIEVLAADLDSRGLRNKRLRTSHAFHSSMMDPAVEALGSVLAGIPLCAPQRPVISTVTGRPLSREEATNPDYWARQLRETVRFSAALDCLAEMGEFALLEVGPGSTLTTLALQHLSANHWAAQAVLPGCGIGEGADLEVLAAVAHCWVHGASVDWQRHWNDAGPRRMPLPTYPFARTRYWLDPPLQQNVAGAGGQWVESIHAEQPNLEATAMNESNHLEGLGRRAIKVLEDTSGYDLKDSDRETSFSEMGFDSLLLTQVSTALKQEFGVNVTFRALLENCTSIRELTEHLARELPAEAVVLSKPVAQLEVSMPMTTPTGVPVDPQSMRSDIKLLIDQQLALMQMQLQVLGAVRGATSGQPGVSAIPETITSATASPVARSQEEKAEEGVPKKQTPGTRIEKSRAGAKRLTRAQQTYVDKLIEDYTKCTGASKAFAQRHRKHLADPRTVSGFNPLWKEMVYPIVTNRSKGSKIWDIDGREYIDLTNGFGPIFFGHSPDFVTEAVLRQIAEGIETGPQSPLAGEVAELFCELTGNERVAYANTGSEAVLAALRLARTVTGREKVVTFEGAYHGIFDEVVVRAGKNGAGLPAAPGIPRSHTSNMIVLPYGTDESLDRIRGMGKELAAVMVETVQSRKPGLQPVEFLKRLREITEQADTALIFDEVVTGFRVHPGGVQVQFDVRADLAAYGKVVAGGYPIGLVAGKAKFMDALDGGQWQFGDESIPEVGVTFFAGTFVRHPLALAATKAVLLRMKAEGPALQSRLAECTTDLARELKAFLREIDAKISLEEYSSYFYISVAPEEQYGSLLFYLLRLYGIHTWEFRPCFLTTSHTDEDIAAFKAAFIRAVSGLVQHGLLQGDAVAVERLNKARSGTPPVEGARLGKDKDGAPAWFVPDPDRPGKYIQIKGRRAS